MEDDAWILATLLKAIPLAWTQLTLSSSWKTLCFTRHTAGQGQHQQALRAWGQHLDVALLQGPSPDGVHHWGREESEDQEGACPRKQDQGCRNEEASQWGRCRGRGCLGRQQSIVRHLVWYHLWYHRHYDAIIILYMYVISCMISLSIACDIILLEPQHINCGEAASKH